jgi:hypothetical protein
LFLLIKLQKMVVASVLWPFQEYPKAEARPVFLAKAVCEIVTRRQPHGGHTTRVARVDWNGYCAWRSPGMRKWLTRFALAAALILIVLLAAISQLLWELPPEVRRSLGTGPKSSRNHLTSGHPANPAHE